MIESFGDSRTERLYHGEYVSVLPQNVIAVACRKLDMLNHAHILDDLRAPPSNHLEQLKGNLKGFYSIRINAQWRILFKWNNGNAEGVRIVDYH